MESSEMIDCMKELEQTHKEYRELRCLVENALADLAMQYIQRNTQRYAYNDQVLGHYWKEWCDIAALREALHESNK